MATFVKEQQQIVLKAHSYATQYNATLAAARAELDRAKSDSLARRDRTTSDSQTRQDTEKKAASDKRARARTESDSHRSKVSAQVNNTQSALRSAALTDWISATKPGSISPINAVSANAMSLVTRTENDAQRISQSIQGAVKGNPSSGSGGIAVGVLFAIIAFFCLWIATNSSFSASTALVLALICGAVAAVALLAGGNARARQTALRRRYADLLTLDAGMNRWHSDSVAVADATYAQETATAERAHSQRVAAINAQYDQEVATAQATYNSKVSAAKDTAAAQSSEMQRQSDALTRRMSIYGAPWDSELWKNWEPLKQASQQWKQWLDGVDTPEGVRAGTLVTPIGDGQLTLPAMVTNPGGNILIIAKGNGKRQAAALVQALMLRLLATNKARRVQFTMIDPVELGQTVAGFMPLKEFNPELVTNKAWSDGRDIEVQLGLLREQIGSIIQDHLQQKYPTIEEYNEAFAELPQPYRILAAMDFPVNFSDSAAKSLVSIVTNGPRCGVCSIIVYDPDKPPPYGFTTDDLIRGCQTIFEWRDTGFVLTQPNVYETDRFICDPPPTTALVEHVVGEIGRAAMQTDDMILPFERIAPPRDEWWKHKTVRGIKVAVGKQGPKNDQYIELVTGDPRVHALVAGQTRSGKTNMLHDLIINASLMYSPRELELYLIDLNQVGFATYAKHRLPQARVIASESGREYGLSVLQGLVNEIKDREDLFSGVQSSAADAFETLALRRDIFDQPVMPVIQGDTRETFETITQFRQERPDVWLPRILLIVDEFQEFFRYDDRIGAMARLHLDQLVRLGGKFGIHVILASQTLMGAQSLPRDTIGQIAVRIAFRSTDSDSRLILDDNPAAAHIPPSALGRGVYSPNNGARGTETGFQSALMEPDVRERYLTSISELAQDQPSDLSPKEPIIFDGAALADIHKNKRLNNLLSAHGWSVASTTADVWLGEPMAIKEPTVAHISPRSGGNLLIVTDDEQQGAALLLTSVLSIGAQFDPQSTQFVVLDFSQADSNIASNFAQLGQRMPHPTRVARRRDLPASMNNIMSVLRQRSEDNRREKPYIFLVVHGLQSATELHQQNISDPTDLENATSPAEQFAMLARLGPEVGIHVIGWCNSYANVSKSLDRALLPEFNLRIVFAQPTSEDSHNLVESSAAYSGNLPLQRAVFYDGGRLEVFRPYTRVSLDTWLPNAMEQLRRKG